MNDSSIRKEPRKDRGIRILFNREIHVLTIDLLREFISCYFSNKKQCRLGRLVKVPNGSSIRIIITETDISEVEEVAFGAHMKERLSADIIPIVLTVKRIRSKIHDNYHLEALSSFPLSKLESFVLQEYNLIYNHTVDPRLHLIPREYKRLFYDKYALFNNSVKAISSIYSPIPKIPNLSKSSKKVTSTILNSVRTGSKDGSNGIYMNVEINGHIYTQYMSNTQHKLVGIDCEMVQTKKGKELGRVGIIDINHKIIYDRIIKPERPVIDYLTPFSGLTEESFINRCVCSLCIPSISGLSIEEASWPCKKTVISHREMIEELSLIIGKNTILVGHSIEHDMHALQIYHTRFIDVSLFFMSQGHYKLKLKDIARDFLNMSIQTEEHSPCIDASTALYALSYALTYSIPVINTFTAPVHPIYITDTFPSVTPSPKSITFVYTDTIPPVQPNILTICISTFSSNPLVGILL
ncbi:RNA exonuclease [Nematocida sp. AWRm80]|nr:RNA exonuclease [Nematocida sp. AWRm80]